MEHPTYAFIGVRRVVYGKHTILLRAFTTQANIFDTVVENTGERICLSKVPYLNTFQK